MSRIRLQIVQLQLQRNQAPLRSTVLQALQDHGRPLRWAITAAQGTVITVEAVVIAEEVM